MSRSRLNRSHEECKKQTGILLLLDIQDQHRSPKLSPRNDKPPTKPTAWEPGIRHQAGLFTRTLLAPVQGHTVDTRSTFGVSMKTNNCHHHHHHHHTPASSNWLPSGVIISPPALLSFPSTSMFLLKNKEHNANSSLYSTSILLLV